MRKDHYKWNLIEIKHPLKKLKKEHLVELILETFILVLIENGRKSHRQNSMN